MIFFFVCLFESLEENDDNLTLTCLDLTASKIMIELRKVTVMVL